MAALTLLFTITGRVKGQSVPSDTDGGNKTRRRRRRRSSLGQERGEEAGSEECKNLYARQVGTPSPLDARGKTTASTTSSSVPPVQPDPALNYTSSKSPLFVRKHPVLSFHLYKTFPPIKSQ